MNPEDEEAKKVRALLVPPPLNSFGISELREYISLLRAEIGRVEAVIAAKDAHRNAAAALFRMPPEREGGA